LGKLKPETAILDSGYLVWKAYQVNWLAESMTDSWHKKALHEIAQVYELLADETVIQESWPISALREADRASGLALAITAAREFAGSSDFRPSVF
jgi:hypothetical protein